MSYEIESIRKIPAHELRTPDLRESARRERDAAEAYEVRVAGLAEPFEAVCLTMRGTIGVAHGKLRAWKAETPPVGKLEQVRRAVEGALAWWKDDR